MDRREFLARAAGATAALLAAANAPGARADSPVSATLTVDFEHPGPTVTPGFVGLSYESSQLTSGRYLSPKSRSLLGLMHTLSSNGVIRIGGNDSERNLWAGRNDAAPVPDRFVITPAAIDRLAAFLRVLDWRLIYGLNLAQGTPEAAAEEAAYVAKVVGPRLLAFQIGNEPDGFGQWEGQRPKSYDVKAFLEEWERFFRAVRARVPNAPFAGPDVAWATGWIPPFAERERGRFLLLTRHYYADGPASSPAVTIEKLLHSDDRIDKLLEDLRAIGRSSGLPYRVAEVNSVFGGGKPGVSATLAEALWGADIMFRLAQAGCDGINIHGGDNRVYTPFAIRDDGSYEARPLYYGMLLFVRASRGFLLPSRLRARGVNLTAYAVRAYDDSLWISLINRDAARTTHVEIDTGRPFAAGSVVRLTAPSIDSQTEVKLGGSTVDGHGGWTPAAEEAVHPSGRAVVIEVPAASAATLQLSLP
jgi:hypothetical protein